MAKNLFKSGAEWKGNAGGRPKGTGLKPLLEAIKRVEKKKKQGFWDRAVEMAWIEPTVMNGILKKLVPDLPAVDDDGNPLPVVHFYIPEKR